MPPMEHRRLTVLLTAGAYLLITLDALVVVTALPSIHADLGGGAGNLPWIINAYALTFAAGIITASALGDRLGRRRTYVGGLVLFSLASAACAEWRKRDRGVHLDPTVTSPKIIAACEPGAPTTATEHVPHLRSAATDLALRAARAMGMTLAGLDILPTRDGYVVLEVNPVAGFLNIFGEDPQWAIYAGVYDWIEKHAG